jgi:hypothetical protein
MAAERIDQIQIFPYFLRTESRFSGREFVSGTDMLLGAECNPIAVQRSGSSRISALAE